MQYARAAAHRIFIQFKYSPPISLVGNCSRQLTDVASTHFVPDWTRHMFIALQPILSSTTHRNSKYRLLLFNIYFPSSCAQFIQKLYYFFRTFPTKLLQTFFSRSQHVRDNLWKYCLNKHPRAQNTFHTHTTKTTKCKYIRDETYRVNVWKKCSISMRQSDCAGRLRWPVTI